MSSKRVIISMLISVIWLSGCGGSGNDSSPTTKQPTNVDAIDDKQTIPPQVTPPQSTGKKTERQENLSYNIDVDTDDAEEDLSTGKVSLTNKKLTLGSTKNKDKSKENENKLVALRFKNIEIPKGTNIVSAYLQFSTHKEITPSENANIRISIEDSADSAAFTAQNKNLSNRNTLNTSVEWPIDSGWEVINEATEKQRSPDLTPLVQSIINKEDWRSSNAISFLLQGNGLRYINAYEGSMDTLEVNDLSATLVIKLTSLHTFTPNAAEDDAEENLKTGKVDVNGSDLELGWEENSADSAQQVGIRFTNINITPNSKIHKAYIQFTQDENKNVNPFAVTIRAEKSANPLALNDSDKNLSSRELTQDEVVWSNPVAWEKLHEAGKLQQTPDLTNLVQERVNDPQWKTGNAMAFFIKGIGTRTAETFESGPKLSPKLVVEYTNASAPFVFDKVRLTWRDDPTSTISVIWNQNVGNKGVVYYDEYKDGKCPQDIKQYAFSKLHTKYSTVYKMKTVTTRLTNLKPDTNYRFIIKNNSGVSECSWFKTAPKTPKPFHYISGGDTKSSGTSLKIARWSNTMVSKVRPLFVFFTGDFNSGIGLDPDSWKQWLTDWSTLTRSEDGRMYPLIAAHGNHESGNFEALYQLFDTGNSNELELANYAYNAYSFGGDLLHLVSLNSEITRVYVLPVDLQTIWLRKVLEKAQNHSLNVVGYHKPMRPHTSSKSEAVFLSSNWAPIFEKYGVDVAYESDSHNHAFTYPIRPAKLGEKGEEGFIRDDLNGTMHVGEGSWGAGPRRTDDDKGWTLESKAINQIKLNRVYPATKSSDARLDISVIKIADRNKDGKLINYVEGVREANDKTPMLPPQSVTFYITPGFGETVSVPFKANKP